MISTNSKKLNIVAHSSLAWITMDNRLLIHSYKGKSFLEWVKIYDKAMEDAVKYFKDKYCSQSKAKSSLRD